jgi:hypothetical protein
MNIKSKEALAELELNKHIIFRNYATPPDISLFYKAYKTQEDVTNSEDGKPLGSMKIAPQYFFEDKTVDNFYKECSSVYNVQTTLLLLEGAGGGSPTTRHSDEADVIHWQCMGKSEWTMYDNPTKGSETKFILNAGDVVWFKKHQDHSVQNLENKVSIIFMENNILKDFLTKQYAAVGKVFE